MVSHTYHHHITFSSEPEKIPENRNPYFDAPYYFLSILSLFTYLFVVRLSAWFEAKIGRKLTDRRGHTTFHTEALWCLSARASQSRAIISKMTMMSCCTNRVCYDLFFNNRPIRVGTLYLKFKKEREFQNFSVIKNEMRKEIY